MAAVLVIAVLFAIVMLAHVSSIRKYQDYYNNGMQYYASGDYANAALYLEKAVKAQETGEAITRLAECYLRLGERDKAIALLEKYQRLEEVAEMLKKSSKYGYGFGNGYDRRRDNFRYGKKRQPRKSWPYKRGYPAAGEADGTGKRIPERQ